jgi:hypothetical protein
MKNPEKQGLKENINQMRREIFELAKSNRGQLSDDMILERLDADAELIRYVLKKMKAKIVGNRIYFPKIEKAYKKRWTWRRIWPFKK